MGKDIHAIRLHARIFGEKVLRIFIGYDPKEAIAYHACVNSLIRRSSGLLSITPLALNNIKGYHDNRRQHIEGYPPTNQFIFSRFLVPSMMDYKGVALFIDGDMIINADIAELFDLFDETKAVQVVQHDYKTKHPIKYLNQVNGDYPRKNWTSVMLFNCGHPDNRKLTPEYIETASGKELHRLEWAENVGELPIEWNWLPDEYGENPQAKLVHYTCGTPCFHDWAMSPMASLWHRERMLANYSLQLP
jgi:lipopolysaccharide biosynthesis glycosyltransferase